MLRDCVRGAVRGEPGLVVALAFLVEEGHPFPSGGSSKRFEGVVASPAEERVHGSPDTDPGAELSNVDGLHRVVGRREAEIEKLNQSTYQTRMSLVEKDKHGKGKG